MSERPNPGFVNFMEGLLQDVTRELNIPREVLEQPLPRPERSWTRAMMEREQQHARDLVAYHQAAMQKQQERVMAALMASERRKRELLRYVLPTPEDVRKLIDVVNTVRVRRDGYTEQGFVEHGFLFGVTCETGYCEVQESMHERWQMICVMAGFDAPGLNDRPYQASVRDHLKQYVLALLQCYDPRLHQAITAQQAASPLLPHLAGSQV